MSLATTLLVAGTLRVIRCWNHTSAPPQRTAERDRQDATFLDKVVVILIRSAVTALAVLCVGALVYGGVYWYRTLGRINETHIVGEYRFRITSVRDPEWADQGESAEDIAVSVYHKSRMVAERIPIGSISDESTPPSFTIRILANGSLFLLVRADREGDVVFAYDALTGETCPGKETWPPTSDGVQIHEDRKRLRDRFQNRIRTLLADERYEL